MKVLGIGSVLLSEGGVNYFVEDITKKYVRLRSELGGYIELERDRIEDMLSINVFTVIRV